MKPGLRIPIYDATKDGNVFEWLIDAAQDYRKIRKRERYVELEKAQLKAQAKDDNKRYKRIQS